MVNCSICVFTHFSSILTLASITNPDIPSFEYVWNAFRGPVLAGRHTEIPHISCEAARVAHTCGFRWSVRAYPWSLEDLHQQLFMHFILQLILLQFLQFSSSDNSQLCNVLDISQICGSHYPRSIPNLWLCIQCVAFH